MPARWHGPCCYSAPTSRSTRGFGWLTTVATHEAWRLASTAHEQPAGTLTNPADHNNEPGERPEPADTDQRGTAEKALDHIEHHDRLQAMRALKPNECEALYLNGLGYSYREIMRQEARRVGGRLLLPRKRKRWTDWSSSPRSGRVHLRWPWAA